jgi:Mg-chelatase subunit ChlD
LALAASVLESCSSNDDDDHGEVTSAGTAGRTGDSGDRTSGTGGTDRVPDGSGTLNLSGAAQEPSSAGGDGASVSRDDACATSTDPATALPAVVQLVVDTSGSMDWPPGWAPESPDDSKPPGATKWEITRDALLTAVEALPDDVALGVNFYPNVQQEDTTCLLNRVAVPLTLLAGPGSKARGAWETALDEVDPVGATPTHGAYRFGLTQLSSSKLPGNRFLLLITDGTPTCTLDCMCTENNEPVDSQPLLDEAAAALTDGIRTFVIGSPGSEDTRDVLSRLARVGGTAEPGCSDDGPNYCHFDMTTEPDLAGGLARALDQIAVDLRSCEYAIPAPPTGQTLNRDQVNVLYTPDGGTTETIARDPSTTECNQGWQYTADGRNIVLCGDTCAAVRGDPSSSIEVLFGCQTVKSKPR